MQLDVQLYSYHNETRIIYLSLFSVTLEWTILLFIYVFINIVLSALHFWNKVEIEFIMSCKRYLWITNYISITFHSSNLGSNNIYTIETRAFEGVSSRYVIDATLLYTEAYQHVACVCGGGGRHVPPNQMLNRIKKRKGKGERGKQ